MVPEAESSPDKPVGYGAPPVLLCEYRDEAGHTCDALAVFKNPGRRYCRHHYDKLYSAGLLVKVKPVFDPTACSTASQATEALAARALNYVKLHWRGALKAAKKGDTRPCEWALLHTRAVTQLDKGDTGPRISVQVGIALPGLGMPAQASESKALPAITVTMGEAPPQLEAESASVNTPKS